MITNLLSHIVSTQLSEMGGMSRQRVVDEQQCRYVNLRFGWATWNLAMEMPKEYILKELRHIQAYFMT